MGRTLPFRELGCLSDCPVPPPRERRSPVPAGTPARTPHTWRRTRPAKKARRTVPPAAARPQDGRRCHRQLSARAPPTPTPARPADAVPAPVPDPSSLRSASRSRPVNSRCAAATAAPARAPRTDSPVRVRTTRPRTTSPRSRGRGAGFPVSLGAESRVTAPSAGGRCLRRTEKLPVLGLSLIPET